MSPLPIEQLVTVLNIIGLFILTSCWITMFAIFYGDYLMKYFNVENKFPKLAKFIQMRRKLKFFLS